MVKGLWGRKIGMTQVFAENKVVPVTVINTADWRVTGFKTQEKDGYTAVQVGFVRPKFAGQEFSAEWLKKKGHYFEFIKEITANEMPADLKLGDAVAFESILQPGVLVDVTGTTMGRGFSGVVKRHGFAGGAASHGDKTGRRTGGIGFMRSRGRVIKGKRLPGHFGVERCVMKNLEVVTIKPDENVILVKGAVPGKPGSFVYIKKND